MTTGYTNIDLQRITGLTHRQVIYLTEKVLGGAEIQDASGRGSMRLYSDRDLFKMLVAQKLRTAGVEVSTAASAISLVSQHDPEIEEWLDRLPGAATLHLVDGKHGCLQVSGRRNDVFDLESEIKPSPVDLIDLIEEGKVKVLIDVLPLLKETRIRAKLKREIDKDQSFQ